MAILSPKEVHQQWRTYKDERLDWAEQATKDRHYYFGAQWTDDEIQVLKERGQAPLVIQRTKPAIDHELAILVAQSPGPRYVAVGARHDSDKALSQAFNDLAYWCWSQNHGDVMLMTAMEHAMTMGLGWMHVWPDYKADFGRGEVMVDYVHPIMVYQDPTAKDPLLRDMKDVIISNWIPRQTVKRMFRDQEEEIDKLKSSWDDNAEGVDTDDQEKQFYAAGKGDRHDHDKLHVIDRYSSEEVKMLAALDVESGDVQLLPPTSVDDPRLRQLVQEGVVRVKETWVERPRRQVIIEGEHEAWSGYAPGQRIPLVPLVNIFADTPYPMSDVSQIRGIQDEINKRRSLMIHNQALSGNNKWIYEEGAVDVKRWRNESSKPGALLPFRQGFESPVPVPPSALPAGLFQLENEAKYDLEYAIGAFGLQLGDPNQSPSTYRGTLAIDDMSNRRLKIKKTRFDAAIKELGGVLRDHLQVVYDGPKTIRLLRENGEVESVAINQPNPQEGAQDPEKPEIPERMNDITSVDFDVAVAVGQMKPTNSMAMTSLMMEMYQAQIVDRKAVLDVMDIDNKDDILKRVDERNQLMQQVQVQDEKIKQLESILNSDQRKMLELLRKVEVAKFKADLDVEKERTKAELDKQETEHEADLEVQEAQHKADLKVQRAQKQASADKSKE